MPLDNALQGCTYRALCDLDHAYLSNSISWLSPQLTLMQIQNPFASLFFFFSSIHSNKWILFLTLVLNFLFCKSSHGWLLFTMQDSTQIASLPWGLPPSYPTFTLFTDPSLFFSPRKLPSSEIILEIHFLFPWFPHIRAGFLPVLFLHPTEVADA